MRVMMVLASGRVVLHQRLPGARKHGTAVGRSTSSTRSRSWWITHPSVALTYRVKVIIPGLGTDGTLWWKLSTVITCGTLAGAIIPEAGEDLHLHVVAARAQVVSSSKEGGASLNILSPASSQATSPPTGSASRSCCSWRRRSASARSAWVS
jgi:K(+)-stimulated pyrophosphate-energized sodium pump